MKNHILTVIFLSGFAVTIGLQLRHQPETFRGKVPASAPDSVTPEQFAAELAESIDLMRQGGMEPERYNFELPDGWAPPTGWKAPEGWQAPDWWQTPASHE